MVSMAIVIIAIARGDSVFSKLGASLWAVSQ